MDPISFSSEIAKQGLGYMLFIFIFGILAWREKVNNDEKKELRNQLIIVTEKRINDLKDIQAASYERTREERQFHDASIDKLKTVLDTLASMSQNILNLLSFGKKNG